MQSFAVNLLTACPEKSLWIHLCRLSSSLSLTLFVSRPLSLLVLPPSLHFPRLVCLINRPSLSFISLPVWLTYLLLLFPLSLHSLFTFIILHLCHAQWSKVKDTDVEVKLHRLEIWASVTHLTQQTTAEEWDGKKPFYQVIFHLKPDSTFIFMTISKCTITIDYLLQGSQTFGPRTTFSPCRTHIRPTTRCQ